MAYKLTIKQDKFCLKYTECGNASEAYKYAYDCGNMKPESINRKAFELIENVKIRARIKDLQSQMAEKSMITKDGIIKLNIDVVNADVLEFLQVETLPSLDDEGNEIGNYASIRFRDLESMPIEKRRLIQKITLDKNGRPVIEFMNKNKAVETLNKMLGFDAPTKIEGQLEQHNTFEGISAEDIAKAVLHGVGK